MNTEYQTLRVEFISVYFTNIQRKAKEMLTNFVDSFRYLNDLTE